MIENRFFEYLKTSKYFGILVIPKSLPLFSREIDVKYEVKEFVVISLRATYFIEYRSIREKQKQNVDFNLYH